jgi:hypothetical protein
MKRIFLSAIGVFILIAVASAQSDSVRAAVQVDTVSAPTPAESTAIAPTVPADSAAAPQGQVQSVPRKSRSNEIVRDKKSDVDTKVEVIQTYKGDVNQLKSVKKAFFLSFIMPGLGEYYAKGSWPRVAAPFAIELGCYASLAIIRGKYNDLTTKYQNYADAHYSHLKFDTWYQFLVNADTSVVKSEDVFSHKDAYYDAYEGKTNDYYEMIGKYDMFVQGWDDADPDMDSAYIVNQNWGTDYDYKFRGWAVSSLGVNSSNELVDTNWIYYHEDANGNTDYNRPRYFGKSLHQIYYMTLRDDANIMADKMLWVFYGMLANRIFSAIDAVLVTSSTNRKITGNTLSAIERVRVRPAVIGGNSPVTNGMLVTYSF